MVTDILSFRQTDGQTDIVPLCIIDNIIMRTLIIKNKTRMTTYIRRDGHCFVFNDTVLFDVYFTSKSNHVK